MTQRFHFWSYTQKNWKQGHEEIWHTRGHSLVHGSEKLETAQVSTDDEWINRTWSIHATECYSTFKRKIVLSHATTWVNLENFMLNIISQ